MIPGKYFLHDSVRGSMGTSIGLVRNTPKKNPRSTGHTSDRLGYLATFCFGRQRMKTLDRDFEAHYIGLQDVHFTTITGRLAQWQGA